MVVKKLQTHLSREHLAQEARILSRLHHPNLVQVIGLEEEQGQLQLILEWVNGFTLREFFRVLEKGEIHSKCLENLFEVFLYILHEILLALRYCHERSAPVVHGDVTPQNILISRQGAVKLADFGIATFQNNKRTSPMGFSQNWGNAKLLPPERLQGKSPRSSDDLYQIGCIMQEMILHLKQERRLNRFVEMTRQALAEKPTQRFACAEDMRLAVLCMMKNEESHADWIFQASRLLEQALCRQTLVTQEVWSSNMENQTLRVAKNLQNKRSGCAFLTGIFGFVILTLGLPVRLHESKLAQIPMKQGLIPSVSQPGLPKSTLRVSKLSNRDEFPAFGVVELQARPWAMVYVNTVSIGSTPLVKKLRPGRYEIEFVNPHVKKPKKRFLEVMPGAHARILMEMQR